MNIYKVNDRLAINTERIQYIKRGMGESGVCYYVWFGGGHHCSALTKVEGETLLEHLAKQYSLEKI